MKKNLALLIILFLSVSARSQFHGNKEPLISQSLAKETFDKVYARTSGGSIEVTGITSGEPRLEIYVTTNGIKEILSKEEIMKRLEQDYQLTVTVADNQLNVIAKRNQQNIDWKRHLNISFKIFVSPKVSTDLSTSGGSINLSNLSGNQSFSTSGGSLHLSKLTGKTNGKTSGGSINISNSSNEINLKTSGGSIRADNCDGDIRLSTSGGSLNLSSLDGKIVARTSGGSIHGNSISGELITHTSGGSVKLQGIAASVDASTSGGSVNVEITKLGKYVKLSNSGGNIHLQMPDKQGLDLTLSGNKIKVEALNNFSGRKEEDEISGTLNGGGVPVNVRAGSGSITLDFR